MEIKYVSVNSQVGDNAPMFWGLYMYVHNYVWVIV